MADRCSACMAAVILAVDYRGKPMQLDATPLSLVVPLSFHVPERVDGFSRAGDHVAGRKPGPGETPNGTVYLPHRCSRNPA